jgi:hypothetical protein
MANTTNRNDLIQRATDDFMRSDSFMLKDPGWLRTELKSLGASEQDVQQAFARCRYKLGVQVQLYDDAIAGDSARRRVA